jgi:hypothetical protein
MKALIDPQTSVKHIVSWTDTEPYKPVFETYLDSARVCEVEETQFDVATPLFWVNCADNVVADEFYFDTSNQTIKPIVNVPYPTVK